MQLPDAEALCAELVKKLRPVVTPATGMVGIHTGGAWLAERLHRELGLAIPLGRLDISFYRDDYRKSGLHKSVKASQIPFDVADRRLLLVDDVLNTGRTIRLNRDQEEVRIEYDKLLTYQDGSAKMAIASVPLFGQEVVWTNGQPQ